MTRRLYDIAGAVLALEDLLLETGGEWTPEVEELFAEVEGSLESKVDSYAALIREWELDAEKWKAEEARISGHRRARENAAKRLKERLLEALTIAGRDKLETPRFKVAIQRTAPGAEILVDAAAIPDELVRVIPETREANKVAILAALKGSDGELKNESGEVIARLLPGNPYVRIR